MSAGPTAAILVAAGAGTRLGTAVPKALVSLAGTPLLLHALRRLEHVDGLTQIVVAVPPAHRGVVRDLLLAATPCAVPVELVDGGATRQASVAAALAVLDPEADVVLVHDAARALAPTSLAERVATSVRAGHAAVVPGLPVTDTIKRVAPPSGEEEAVLVVDTVDRAELRAVQTPQGFARGALVRAHEVGAARAVDEGAAATDDAGLVEALGEHVWMVPGEELAMKITTARDLEVAALLLAEAS
ncbi:2-C-methyl-D-erythritol 4-phosphate cytidylyltransferase [Beutenbergia cavernae DSM 12333]|uniref:2-C-methyl-D-erythritol 4-phosphate cytidylyltransferase n=1 Tax=Beutenbergia cavernae (strain ATCC BAA-8 / DSM 12333 / CCUG 43141 / JCM 11478 / NBRC 16432 / NCIMB 13614 / HKI 0122) TaxID=471853 RepID=C5BYS7_BEUC1|nr:2-C-methyl-D-erythritol 4-phosphate cytidylyltransferase [Beutenbergia cavernae]ACQ79035.1 2-C-methyl-D-erythritol 4-phosphate cytidylyltransferase [Beutenbergia cavernae DSM 12333]